jgi:hypothetical protein
MKINRKGIVLINLPVEKPEKLRQCGTWSIVYPPSYNRTKKKTLPKK